MRHLDPQPRWYREPLVYFGGLGALVFALHALLTDAQPPSRPPLVAEPAFVEALRAAREQAGLPPEANVAEAWIREEALVREARLLGLDRGDPIIRRRLVRRMELYLEAREESTPPTDAELTRHLAGHRERYLRPRLTAFEHRFFSRERESAEEDASRAVHDPDAGSGDVFLLGQRFSARSDAAIDAALGEGFAERLAALPVARWAGPIPSSFGWHLVRVETRTEPRLPPLPSIRERVLRDVERERRSFALRRAVREVVDAHTSGAP